MAYKKQGLYLPQFEHDNCGAGFIASLKNERTHDIIHKSLNILCNLEHRGAVSSDGKTGDGAGILIELPHKFFKQSCGTLQLPQPGNYAVAMVFLPKKDNQRQFCIDTFEGFIIEQGLIINGWRNVPVNPDVLGRIATETQPEVMQLFVSKPNSSMGDLEFRTKVFIARKLTENKITQSKLSERKNFYVASFSTNTIIYKGLLMPQDISAYYPDLVNPLFVTRFALVHQRFSTNTFP
ncbi:MAG: glutamate synthase subunit alpha, partial [Saprospiraceae bacterium]|nr:glutamate synthase subunit alpha [Saprospiraceae bacterium]